jgi:hypothetical protein
MKNSWVIIGLVVLMFGLSSLWPQDDGRANAASVVTFNNRTGHSLYVFYKIVASGNVYCSRLNSGGSLPAGSSTSFSVPAGKKGFFNFRTCSSPCNSDCPSLSKWTPYKNIDVWVIGRPDWEGERDLF